MNPVNATALYVSASRLVLNYDPGDPQSFTEINKLLPYFRQSLSCCVCGEDLSFVPCTMSPPRARSAPARRPEETPRSGSAPRPTSRPESRAMETFLRLRRRAAAPAEPPAAGPGRGTPGTGGRRTHVGPGGGSAAAVLQLGKGGVKNILRLRPAPHPQKTNAKWGQCWSKSCKGAGVLYVE